MPQDIAEAKRWYRMAKNAGSDEAEDLLDEL